jgi:four helix bundle protein
MSSGSESGGYTPIERLDFFSDLEALSDQVWEQVCRWDSFQKNTVGSQLVRALDSVGANLVEGDGRHSDKESLQFFSIAKASGREARYWLSRARKRELLDADQAEDFLARLESVVRRLNALITTRRRRLSQVHEESTPYYVSLTNDNWDQ